jgi:anti-sigma factor RsiW
MRLRIGLSREIVCRQAVELVTDYLEGALSRGERRRLEQHLASCPHCREYLAQIRATIRLTGTVRPDDLSLQMQDDFIELYRRWAGEGTGGTDGR